MTATQRAIFCLQDDLEAFQSNSNESAVQTVWYHVECGAPSHDFSKNNQNFKTEYSEMGEVVTDKLVPSKFPTCDDVKFYRGEMEPVNSVNHLLLPSDIS